MSGNKEVEYIIRPPEKVSFNFKEVWKYRELIYFFVWRDIKVKYKQTVLGFLWAIIQPILITTIFVVFFAKNLKISTDNIPPAIFYFSGLIFWNLFSSGIIGASNSMIGHANMVKKVYFPRLIIPISSILTASFDFLMALIVFIFLFLYYRYAGISLDLIRTGLFFTLAFLLVIIFTIGMGVLTASLNVKYRDFRYVMPFFNQFLFFSTPIIFPISLVESSVLKTLISFNPMTGVAILSRGGFNTDVVDWELISFSFIIAVIILIVSIYNFRRTEAYIADLL